MKKYVYYFFGSLANVTVSILGFVVGYYFMIIINKIAFIPMTIDTTFAPLTGGVIISAVCSGAIIEFILKKFNNKMFKIVNYIILAIILTVITILYFIHNNLSITNLFI